jgi:ribosome-binding protein aMBF1 (putative translation factor)
MNKNLILGVILGGTFLLSFLIIFSMSVSYNNTNVDLMELITAQNQKVALHFDNTFKKIQQIAQVADKSKDAFKELYIPLMEARYGNDQTVMMKWITESNPNFDNSLYKKVADVIESSRDELTNEQDKLADYIRERNAFIKKWPASSFVKDKLEIKANFISSRKTKDAVSTGEDNDIDVFQSAKTLNK